MGTIDGLVSAGARPDAVAFKPAQSPFMTTGKAGPHRVERTGVGFEPPLFDRSRLKEARTVDQELAFDMCRRLAREEGIFGGTSTGMNIVGAIQVAAELGPGGRVVTLGCDNGVKYLWRALVCLNPNAGGSANGREHGTLHVLQGALEVG